MEKSLMGKFASELYDTFWFPIWLERINGFRGRIGSRYERIHCFKKLKKHVLEA